MPYKMKGVSCKLKLFATNSPITTGVLENKKKKAFVCKAKHTACMAVSIVAEKSSSHKCPFHECRIAPVLEVTKLLICSYCTSLFLG